MRRGGGGRAGGRRPPLTALTVILLLPAGCGSTLYKVLKAPSPRPPADAFDCVKGQITAIGYVQDSIDVDAGRINARKYDWTTRSADTQFRRMVDRLSVEIAEVQPGGTELRVGAHTFAELVTVRGPTEVERSASPGAKAAAQALLDACGH